MKRIAVVVVVVSLLALAQIGEAANLDSTWYVKLGSVALYGFNPNTGLEFAIDWNFTSPVGVSGPFAVAQPAPTWPQRMVSVPTTANGVAAGTAVYLYGQPVAPMQWPADRLDVPYETQYDSSQMLVQLYVQRAAGPIGLLWTQPGSGHRIGNASVLSSGMTISPADTVYFRVVAVPEPSQCLALLLPTLGILIGRRRALR